MLAIFATMITAAAIAFASVPAAYAYNGNAAGAWADRYATNPYTWELSEDCTNFVSQALHFGGGYSYVGGSSVNSDSQWWVKTTVVPKSLYRVYSRTYIFAPDLQYFLRFTYPGGIPSSVTAHTYTEQVANYTPGNIVTGDVLFYDWDSNGTLDHADIQTGIGTDPHTGWYGNYVDTHTTDRYHAFWSLLPYNSRWASTTISFMHIDPANH